MKMLKNALFLALFGFVGCVGSLDGMLRQAFGSASWDSNAAMQKMSHPQYFMKYLEDALNPTLRERNQAAAQWVKDNAEKMHYAAMYHHLFDHIIAVKKMRFSGSHNFVSSRLLIEYLAMAAYDMLFTCFLYGQHGVSQDKLTDGSVERHVCSLYSALRARIIAWVGGEQELSGLVGSQALHNEQQHDEIVDAVMQKIKNCRSADALPMMILPWPLYWSMGSNSIIFHDHPQVRVGGNVQQDFAEHIGMMHAQPDAYKSFQDLAIGFLQGTFKKGRGTEVLVGGATFVDFMRFGQCCCHTGEADGDPEDEAVTVVATNLAEATVTEERLVRKSRSTTSSPLRSAAGVTEEEAPAGERKLYDANLKRFFSADGGKKEGEILQVDDANPDCNWLEEDEEDDWLDVEPDGQGHIAKTQRDFRGEHLKDPKPGSKSAATIVFVAGDDDDA